MEQKIEVLHNELLALIRTCKKCPSKCCAECAHNDLITSARNKFQDFLWPLFLEYIENWAATHQIREPHVYGPDSFLRWMNDNFIHPTPRLNVEIHGNIGDNYGRKT